MYVPRRERLHYYFSLTLLLYRLRPCYILADEDRSQSVSPRCIPGVVVLLLLLLLYHRSLHHVIGRRLCHSAHVCLFR